jgi:hypothetical protein
MRFFTALVVALTADSVVASSWFGKTVYNKWHQTELERWLSDHNVPYPTPADRKDLENLVKTNWNAAVVQPYQSWETPQLMSYLKERGYAAKKGTEKNKDSLITQVKSYWYETENDATSAYENVRDWIFDSWTDSQLKSFLDKNGIPNPTPTNRASLLKTARENYQSIANKLGQNYYYPGNWLYENWSDSDLKSWLDERGYPVPQPTSRDKLIASLRRNSRLANSQASAAASSASASAASAQASLSDALFDSWSESQLKKWFDENGVKVPQGSKKNELIALARKHRARLYGDSASATMASAYGAATSNANNQYAQATAGAQYYVNLVREKLGFAASQASSSATSLTGAAAKSASSASLAASKSAVSASKEAVKSASSASKSAGKNAQKATDAATESVSKGKHRAQEAAQQATDYAKEEL